MMQTFVKFIKKYRGPIISGLLTGFTYIPFPSWAVLFCYVPLWIFILKNELSLKEVFIAGWLTQFLLTLIGFHWIAYTAHEFGGFPWILSIVTLILFCTFIHLYIPLSVVLAAGLKRKCQLSPGGTLLVCALSLSLLERIWPSIFPWNLAYGLLWTKLPMFHWADSLGFLGLSTILFLLNALIAYGFVTSRKKEMIAAALVIFLVLNVSGSFHQKPWQETDSEFRALAIQANIGNAEKVQAEKGYAFQEFIIGKFISDTRSGLEKYPDTDLIVWPETAIPYYMDQIFHEHRYPRMIKEALNLFKKPLLAGAYSQEPSIQNRDHSVFNALFLLGDNSNVIGSPYRKTHLLAFGEYLPLSENFPILLKWLPFIANFGRGQGPQILTWPRSPNENLNFGGQICYEGLYPDFSRELSKQGAQILANVTNDSWFGKTFEPNQHMIMTFARAIETRRPLIRSTNTGITSAILADGEILEKSPTHTTWFGQFKIKYLKSPPQTFYVLYGHWDWVIWLILLIGIVVRGLVHVRVTKP